MTLYYFLLKGDSPHQPFFWTMTRQVSEYSNKWKMTFNPDITTKQAQEVEFSRKSIKTNHRPVFLMIFHLLVQTVKWFWYASRQQTCFNKHIKDKTSKANTDIGKIRKLNNTLRGTSLLTMYKSLLSLTLTTVISCMINPIQPITKAFVTKAKECSIMQHL